MTTYANDLTHNRDIDDSGVEYPYSDGEPVAESDLQLDWLLHIVQVLKTHFEGLKEIYAAGNMFVYFENGNPSAVVAPDVFVVKGVENKLRYSFKVWEENKTPDFVLEITSKSTAVVDQSQKMGIYAFLGVKEYILFDPTCDTLEPPFKFYKLAALGYELIQPEGVVNGYDVYPSEIIGLELHVKEGDLRLYNPSNQTYYNKFSDQVNVTKAAKAEAEAAKIAAEEAQVAKEQEAAARQAAEKRIVELEAELERLKNRDQ